MSTTAIASAGGTFTPRSELKSTCADVGTSTQLRHAHAVEMRQRGHANLGITSIYLQGIDSSEIISTVHGRPSPTISASAGLQMRR
jgi:hypothetical protein